MSKKTHTPGPWVWNGKHGSLHRAGEKPYQFGEAVLRPTWEYDEGSDLEISEPNALLIAAAPEMLEALEQNVSAFMTLAGFGPEIKALIGDDGWSKIADAVQASRAALSKATGGAS